MSGVLGLLLTQAQQTTLELQRGRELARGEAIRVIRHLEDALVIALNGEDLKGLPKLCGRYQAANVRRPMFDAPLPPPNGFGESREVLVLAPDGYLGFARAIAGRDGFVAVQRTAEDSELVAEDVDAVVRTIVESLRRHLACCERGLSRYAQLQELAIKVEQALV